MPWKPRFYSSNLWGFFFWHEVAITLPDTSGFISLAITCRFYKILTGPACQYVMKDDCQKVLRSAMQAMLLLSLVKLSKAYGLCEIRIIPNISRMSTSLHDLNCNTR